MTLTPRDRRSRTTSNNFCDSCSESDDVGSSMMRTRAFVLSALAISTSCCLPIGSVLDQRLRRDIEPDHVEVFLRFALDRAPVDHAEPARLATQENVRGDTQVIGKIQFLMDQRDALLESLGDRSELDRLSVDEDFARRGLRDAGHDPHERALARAVLADDRQHFAPLRARANVIQRSHAGELLANAAHFEQGRRRISCHWHSARRDGRRIIFCRVDP